MTASGFSITLCSKSIYIGIDDQNLKKVAAVYLNQGTITIRAASELTELSKIISLMADMTQTGVT